MRRSPRRAMADAPCVCRRPPFRHTDYDTVDLGADSRGAEVALATCRSCGTAWLNYHIDEPQYRRSGRWWRVETTAADARALSADAARAFIEHAPAGFAGGSYFDSQGHAVTAPITVR